MAINTQPAGAPDPEPLSSKVAAGQDLIAYQRARRARLAREQEDAEWLYGRSAAGLRLRAATELAAEFGDDVEEWLV
jgi:hypothetical protein